MNGALRRIEETTYIALIEDVTFSETLKVISVYDSESGFWETSLYKSDDTLIGEAVDSTLNTALTMIEYKDHNLKEILDGNVLYYKITEIV